MKKSQVENIINGVAVIAVLYLFLKIGFLGILFSVGVALVAYAYHLDMPLVAASAIFGGIFWHGFLQKRIEAFALPYGMGNPREISGRVTKIAKQGAGTLAPPPEGVLPGIVEGFEDATPNSAEKKEGAPAESKPAPPDETPSTPGLVQEAPKKESFTSAKTSGMFKLGDIPSDARDGAHIDVGTTMMQALNALKPDQVKAMTDDTKKLLETQKSLMGMLNSLKPMLTDGKQMMDTFSEMFGNQ